MLPIVPAILLIAFLFPTCSPAQDEVCILYPASFLSFNRKHLVPRSSAPFMALTFLQRECFSGKERAAASLPNTSSVFCVAQSHTQPSQCGRAGFSRGWGARRTKSGLAAECVCVWLCVCVCEMFVFLSGKWHIPSPSAGRLGLTERGFCLFCCVRLFLHSTHTRIHVCTLTHTIFFLPRQNLCVCFFSLVRIFSRELVSLLSEN